MKPMMLLFMTGAATPGLQPEQCKTLGARFTRQTFYGTGP